MDQIPSSYKYDFWFGENGEPQVQLTCFMPNGVCILLEAHRNATLHEIKEALWKEATKFPLYRMLHDSSSYIFSCITSMAEHEELLDENRRLCEVKPFCCVLRVIERKGDKAENTQNISQLIRKGSTDCEEILNPVECEPGLEASGSDTEKLLDSADLTSNLEIKMDKINSDENNEQCDPNLCEGCAENRVLDYTHERNYYIDLAADNRDNYYNDLASLGHT